MSNKIHLSSATANAVPELNTTLAERRSGRQDILEAAMHYRSAERLAWLDTQARAGLSQAIQSDPDLQARAFREKESLKSDIVQEFRRLAQEEPQKSPKVYELHHEMMVAEQCFAVHMAERFASEGTPDPEDAGRFARCRLGLSQSPEDFYVTMNLISQETCELSPP